MELHIGGWRTVQNPSEDQIREAVRELDDFEGFVLLSKADDEFIQSSGSSYTGFDLEYREGAHNPHYRAKKVRLRCRDNHREACRLRTGRRGMEG